MSSNGGTAEAGEASLSAAALITSGPSVRLPEDALAVEWWLARRAIENACDGGAGKLHGGAGADAGVRRTRAEVRFAEEGVLALWPGRRAETDRWTFGLEFEFAAADAGWVAQELHALGLCAAPHPVPYHSERPAGFWSVEHDRSVTSVFECDKGGPSVIVGGEVVSPPLRDTAECWRQVALVLAALARCGATVNRTCGLHVHIGADALRDGGDGPATQRDLIPALSRLAMLASVCFEDLVFRMASAEGGAHRGRPVFYRHCRPLDRELRPAYESLADLTGDLGLEGAARRAALNLTNVGDPRKDTIEFRQCNGTLDGRVVQTFVRLCAALVGAARWQPEAARLAPQPLGTHHDKLHDAEASADGKENDPTALWRFLAAVFPSGLPAEAAAALLWLFRRGAWQPSLVSLAAS